MARFRIEFEWDPSKASSNVAKHRVTFDAAMSVFRDPLSATIIDDSHGADEERWITMGSSANGSLVLVVHTWRQTGVDSAIVRIISARKPTKREARQYAEGQP